jgi:tetratricopeptide (TPR) repeat protein
VIFRLRIVPTFLVIFLSAVCLHAQTTSGEELNLGVRAYKQARFEEAVQHFEKSIELAPDNNIAHLYLATTYAQQYIPGAETPENIRFADQALEHYQRVLDGDPAPSAKIASTKAVAYLYLQTKKFDDSKRFYRMASDLDPNDPENYYSIAVIDWTVTYVPRQEERAKLGMKPEDSLPAGARNVCFEMKEKNSTNIEEAINNLNKALQLRRDYDDAMAYMNLMYRERADIQCDDPVAHDADLKTADDWVDKAMATKKVKEKKSERARKPFTIIEPPVER